MRRCNTICILSFLISSASGLGCASSDSGSDTKVTAGVSALDPGAGVSLTDSGACIVTTSAPAERSGDASAVTVRRRWRSYLAEEQVLREIAIDAEGRPLPASAAENRSAYTKLDAEGHTLVFAVEAGGGSLLRSDFRRDRHGNVMSYRRVHTEQRDLDATPREAVEVSYDFVNHYSSAGLLEKHNRADSSASLDYRHDAEGRCEWIVDDTRAEHRDYDASGRLSVQLVELLNPSAPSGAVDSADSSSIVHRYDEQGRCIAIEQDGGGPAALPADGQPDVQTSWSYADDGSWQIETVDFLSDTPNDSVERDGTRVDAQRQTESWSAGCAAVQASIPVPTGSACRTD